MLDIQDSTTSRNSAALARISTESFPYIFAGMTAEPIDFGLPSFSVWVFFFSTAWKKKTMHAHPGEGQINALAPVDWMFLSVEFAEAENHRLHQRPY